MVIRLVIRNINACNNTPMCRTSRRIQCCSRSSIRQRKWIEALHLNPLAFILLLSFSCFSSGLHASNTVYMCSAIPSYFTWQLNFALPCEPANITHGSGTGISRYACQIHSTDPNNKPVQVNTAQIIELSDNLRPLKATKLTYLNLTDGDELSYVSVSLSDPSVVLGGMSVKLEGFTTAGKHVYLSWTVQYSNSSNADEMAFSEGDRLGWTKFVSNRTDLQ